MNWAALKTSVVWLHALLSAAIVGGVDALANLVFAGPINWRVVATVAGVGAFRATIMHLKKSPLPQLQWPDPTRRRAR